MTSLSSLVSKSGTVDKPRRSRKRNRILLSKESDSYKNPEVIDQEDLNRPLESQEVSQLKKELVKAHSQIKKLEVTNLDIKETKLTKNEKKILSAILSEMAINGENSKWVRISHAKMRDVYRVHPNYLMRSLMRLISLEKIAREETSYSGVVKTYKYRLLDSNEASSMLIQ